MSEEERMRTMTAAQRIEEDERERLRYLNELNAKTGCPPSPIDSVRIHAQPTYRPHSRCPGGLPSRLWRHDAAQRSGRSARLEAGPADAAGRGPGPGSLMDGKSHIIRGNDTFINPPKGGGAVAGSATRSVSKTRRSPMSCT